MSTTKFHSLTQDSREISYAIDIPINPPTPQRIVLLANSLCAPFTSWDHVVPRLTSLGLTVLRYDQPGHGLSDSPSNIKGTTFHTLATDVRMLLAHMGIKSLHAWVGVSMGAATGLVFAATNPGIVDRLVVCDTISGSPSALGGQDVFTPRIRATKEDGNMDKLVEGTLKRWFGERFMDENHAEADRMRKLMLNGNTLSGFETCCNALLDPEFDLRDNIARSAGRNVKRALLVVGEKDANLPDTMGQLRDVIAEGLLQVGGGNGGEEVKFRVIKGAGHVPYIDGFEEFVDVVGRFVADE